MVTLNLFANMNIAHHLHRNGRRQQRNKKLPRGPAPNNRLRQWSEAKLLSEEFYIKGYALDGVQHHLILRKILSLSDCSLRCPHWGGSFHKRKGYRNSDKTCIGTERERERELLSTCLTLSNMSWFPALPVHQQSIVF